MSYKKCLDDQLQQKDLLRKQAQMTRTEKGMNKSKAAPGLSGIDVFKKSSLVPGFHNEYPLKNVTLTNALRQAVS